MHTGIIIIFFLREGGGVNKEYFPLKNFRTRIFKLGHFKHKVSFGVSSC